MVSDKIEHACIKVLEEISMQNSTSKVSELSASKASEHDQKYQGTIGFKITTRSNKVSEE